MNRTTRTEKDAQGEMSVPSEAYFGIHSLRAAANFKISGFGVRPELIRAYAMVKKAAAWANEHAGILETKISAAIRDACDEVIEGRFADQFIVDAFQGGAGTSTNMNVNEVVANRAIEILGGEKGDYRLVHPIDHVNLSQSTNDTYITALKIASIYLVRSLSEACAMLQESFQGRERAFAHVMKTGRTHLQDAVPVTLGQEFSAYAEAIARDRWRLYKVEERLRQINLGGSAVGTGLNAPRKYIFNANEKLREFTGLGLARAENMVDCTQNLDVFVEVGGLLKTCAVNVLKICNDLRLLASGPRAGLGEIHLPDMQSGSTIMPGKVNPVIPEVCCQAAFQVIGNDATITHAVGAGQLELNVMGPVIAHNILESLTILRNAIVTLKENCVDGIVADEARCRESLENSLAAVTALTPFIGYDRASEIAKRALAESRPIRDVILEMSELTVEALRKILSPEELAHPCRMNDKT